MKKDILVANALIFAAIAVCGFVYTVKPELFERMDSSISILSAVGLVLNVMTIIKHKSN